MKKTDLLALILATGFSLAGLFAFSFPSIFFALLPEYYGTFNYHFVKDAGIAFFSSGALLLTSLKINAWQLPLTIGAAMFIILHGLFHIQMLAMGMASTLVDLLTEIVVIISPAILTSLLLALRFRERNHSTTG